MMPNLLQSRGAGHTTAVLGIAALTAILAPFHAHLNHTTVALALLMGVLFVAATWGSRPALVASMLGVLGFNFFFLPPLYTFTIADPQNWVVLGACFVTALTAGQLSDYAKRCAAEAEAVRKETRQRSVYTRNLLEASLDPLVTIGTDGRIDDANSAIEVVTGRSRAELIGSDFAECFTQPERARAAYQELLREGFVRDCSLELRHRDGHVTSVLYSASLRRDDSGKVVGAVVAARVVPTSAGAPLRPPQVLGVVRTMQRFTVLVSAVIVTIGVLSLAGWILDIGVLKSIIPGQVIIKPNTAVCLLLTGFSLWFLRTKEHSRLSALQTITGRLMAAIVTLVGALSLSEHVFGWNLGIDEVLFRDTDPWEAFGSLRPGLMAPITAAAFCLIGLALLLMDWSPSVRSQRIWPAQLLALASGLGALVGLLDFVLGSHTSYTHVALQTAIALFLVSCALLCARTEGGVSALLASSSVGGTLTRRLLPAAVAVPAMFGTLAWKGYAAGLSSQWSASTFMIVAMIVLLSGVAFWNGYLIDRSDSERGRAEGNLRRREEELREAERLAGAGSWRWDPRTDSVTWSEGLYRITGRDPKLPPPGLKEQSGFFTPESFARLEFALEEALQAGVPYALELEMVRADGATRTVKAHAEVERDAGGQAVLVRGTFHDITELKQTEHEARRLERMQAVVAELGQRALRGEQPAGFLEETAGLVTRVLEVALCEVLELRPDGRELFLRAGAGWKEGLVGTATVSAFGDSHAGFTLVSRGPVIIHDLAAERRFGRPALLLEHSAVSGMSIIIPMSEGAYGVLGAWSTRRRTFSSDDARFLQAVANVLGSTIERFRTDEARQRASEALRESEANLNRAQEVAHIGSWHLDLTRNRLTWSDEVFRMFGVPLGAPLTYEAFLAMVHPGDREALDQAWIAALHGAPYDLEHRLLVNGELKWVRERAKVEFDSTGNAVEGVGTVQDVTDRKRAELELLRKNRAYRALSRCNQALIHAVDEGSWLEQVCQIVVDEAGYRFCWVGRAEQDEGKSVKPVAQAGFDDGYLEKAAITWADTERGRGPTGTCIRTGQTQVVKEVATDPRFSAWRAEALKRGYASSIAIPLIVGSKPFGALSIYASEADAFGEAEVSLLSELAGDLSYGIATLRTRAEHDRAEEEIRRLNADLELRVMARTAELHSANRLKDELLVRERAAITELERARERESDIGYRIQQTLLLDQPPRDISGLRMAALSIPSQKIDGDFYAFFRHPDQRLDIMVGDVMGKGIPAALLGAATKSHFTLALSHLLTTSGEHSLPEPKEIVTLAHAELAPHLIELESFVTLCYARLDLDRRSLELVDCGHTGMLHVHHGTGECEAIHGDNLPLGFREGELYSQLSISFELGDLLVFYSDGITEARGPDGELFGLDRLAACIRSNRDLEPEALVETIRQAAFTFSDVDRLADDLTCVVVKAIERETPLARAELSLRSDLGELARTREFIRAFCSALPGRALDDESMRRLELAVTEACSNVMKHAYHGRDDQKIHMEAEAFPANVTIRLHHLGDPFDPSSVPPPSFDGSRESGFGVYLITQSVDEVKYYRDERGRNCVVLIEGRTPRHEREIDGNGS